ncbi:Armadillo/beta-catenin-like repeat family protein [Trichomonas vaginalis G3]|uniref:Armadillo/beta-catenin-like repeat family protein n=1 Tax=Trichomonas vaginalis (strain ATCC PRA-98 / G3) TaxID=412133 RepID=A2DAJ7_TRIV3|nr:sperm-associated antigen 6 family [Trichomonas vaginalis G3]EAY22500.1 Armadillo/beta-catenin-like repeat family protein [Trichomonas vaginalis G3]KAI5497226.1 sperm-associated antigen 6 family [Trichomonas vaginalis G3]|eukprot:XP_001583486.1 Armadillo/beta-catenin-like repeat family protein [Trichomonas vaginalis G3]
MSAQLDKDFANFEQCRRNFVRTVAEAASRSENVERLLKLRVLNILHPLLLDDVPAIQQSTALALGRLANYDENIAQQIVDDGVLVDIVNGLSSEEDLSYQKNACFVLRTVSKHSAELAEKVVENGALGPIVCCLQSYDTRVRESAAVALGSIASHTPELAHSVVDAQGVPLLITSTQSNDLSLKRIAIAAIGDIAKHDAELSNFIIEANGIEIIAPLIKDQDPKLRTVACSTLAHIAKHQVESAERIVNAGIFPHVLLCLRDKEPEVRKAAATLIREIVKHTQELSQRIITEGGAVALVQYLKPDQGNDPIYGVMSIGYIASFSQSLATVLLQSGAADVCLNVFVQAKSDQTKAAAAWTLGQLGKHTSDTAAALAKLNVLTLLLNERIRASASKDLVQKTDRAMELIVQKCTMIEALQKIIDNAPDNVLEFVLEQISKIIPKNPKMRVPFIQEGGFAAVQKVKAEPGTKIKEYVDAINACYPDQAVKYYSPDFKNTILNDIEQFGQ